MEHTLQSSHSKKQNRLIVAIKQNSLVTFTICFLFFNKLTRLFVASYSIAEEWSLNYFRAISWIAVIFWIYFLQWLVTMIVISNITEERLRQKLLKHPLVTITMIILCIIVSFYQVNYDFGIVGIFEGLLWIVSLWFLLWLLLCWISGIAFRWSMLQWNWYSKIINLLIDIVPTTYKIIFGAIITVLVLALITMCLVFVFKYSGQDLKSLFNN